MANALKQQEGAIVRLSPRARAPRRPEVHAQLGGARMSQTERQPFLFTLFGALIRGNASEELERGNIKRAAPHLFSPVRYPGDIEVPAPDSAENEVPIQNIDAQKAPDQSLATTSFPFYHLQPSKQKSPRSTLASHRLKLSTIAVKHHRFPPLTTRPDSLSPQTPFPFSKTQSIIRNGLVYRRKRSPRSPLTVAQTPLGASYRHKRPHSLVNGSLSSQTDAYRPTE